MTAERHSQAFKGYAAPHTTGRAHTPTWAHGRSSFANPWAAD